MKETTPFPAFPEFKNIEFSDKARFEYFVNQFDVYSDFNFNSFFSWDTDGLHKVSELNGNLVLKFSDYVTGEPFYSFIGNNDVLATAETLLKQAERDDVNSELKLIPEVLAREIKKDGRFLLEEDPHNHDYIFSIENLALLQGNKFKSKRRAASKREKAADVVLTFNEQGSDHKEGIMKFIKAWETEKKLQGKEVDMELEQIAIERIIDHLDYQEQLVLTCAYKDNILVGFSIDEILPGGYVLSHYFKTLHSVPGLAEFLNQKVAQNLKEKGAAYWNWEQDLGIESLKRMKQSHRPIEQKQKFILKRAV